MEKDEKTAIEHSSLHAGKVLEATPYEIKAADGTAKPQLSNGSFSTYYAVRAYGSTTINCSNASINSNSRVFASVCEYETVPSVNRVIGAASMFIQNVCPYNGGVKIWLNINWSSYLNIRVDILVDP